MSPSGGENEKEDNTASLEEKIINLSDKVNKLVDTISQLNATIMSLQSEKSELIKKIHNMECESKKLSLNQIKKSEQKRSIKSGKKSQISNTQPQIKKK